MTSVHMNPSLASVMTAPFLPLPFLERDVEVVERADGVVMLSSRVPLGEVQPHLPAVLRRHSLQRPQSAWLMQRQEGIAGWRSLTYGEARAQVDAVTQWLLEAGAPDRNVMVLSGNSLEHAVFEIAAMQARMPYVPVTPAYSLLSDDHAKLRAMVALIRPAIIFVQEAQAFERALQAVVAPETKVVYVGKPVDNLAATPWAEVVKTPVTSAVDASVDAIRPETVGKYLFTSGSTGVPKAVPITQHMLCSTMAMHAQTVRRTPDMPEAVLLEWLPWSHVAGGTAIFNSVLEEGGTLYLDDGRPVPGDFDRTLRNLREISPTRFSSVPAGYAMLVDALENDEAMAQNFFRQMRRLTSSGAKLPDAVYNRIQALAVRCLGHRIPFVAGYGSTETCAATMVVHWPSERAGLVGLPQPGVAIKLVPLEDNRYEVRVKGPSVMPGYLDQPELTRTVFDEEGYYTMGDAVSFVDRKRPLEGLAFSGRVAEEFKLQSGIFVRVGTLRVEAINAAAPLLSDVVVAGADREYVALLAWPNMDAIRQRFGDVDARKPWAHAALRKALSDAFATHNASHTGSSMRVNRLMLLTERPLMDAGEITDKGYVNQRAVLARRADLVDLLYESSPGDEVIVVERGEPASR
ncbi:AMP-binding protein [Hydrogenophaga aquatica]